ncbi:hypothetical protein SAMN05518871_109154 [Psychrobacillus sp. OK028]|uniref:hypothetical protein n=1 Tax=Psychrobacillus sp. OK028 TaxID=1884359 RepID=UPI00088DDDC0|nr:hypothetical protein [Psychrobacillus sp. OK028]SDO03281.1 hypothetical protein SAMN05518871_109154 [Psychrobacillus sp. OK028]
MRLHVEEQYDHEDNSQTVYSFTNTKAFSPISVISTEVLEEVFEFAFGMSFGGQGYHRNHRAGGIDRRRNGQIFADTFQGKLAEFALWDFFISNNLEVPKPDTEMYEEGIWDTSDFEYKDIKIAVKSTKSYGQLMLLESEDWNDEGLYIPNLNTGNELYHYFILLRIQPFTQSILLENRCLFNDIIDKDSLKELIMQQEYSYDIPGYITNRNLVQLIENNYFIPQGAYLNVIHEKNKMDADNYYIQTGHMHPINRLIKILQNL